MNLKFIRNFCIIAHIDHGKSTLAKQLLNYTKNKNKKNIIDNMELEKEKGITIKNHIIQINYLYKKKKYLLNLIDTPGHADFTYEVYKSILACEGAILLIDISKNIQSQTLLNFQYTFKKKIKIIPVLNKIDLNIKYKNVVKDVQQLLKCEKKDILHISAKKGIGIEKVIKNIIKKIPSPLGKVELPLQALIIDSYYNNYKGLFLYFRIFNGFIKKKDKIKLLSNNCIIRVDELGFINSTKKKQIINAGNVGFLLYKTKKIENIKIGDILVNIQDNKTKKILNFKKIKPNIFLSIYPLDNNEYKKLEKSIKKLKLNDYSFTYFKEFSKTLGLGFRCGFLGILHFEIIKERIQREYNINIITTLPNVLYEIILKNKKKIIINNPSELPKKNEILEIKEPYVKIKIISNCEFLGKILNFCIKKRGKLKFQEYINKKQIKLIFEIPYNEIIEDFNNKIKIITKGFNDINYDFIGFKHSNIVKVDIFINKIMVEGFSFLSNIEKAIIKSKKICKKLKLLIPKKQFNIIIQASISNKIIVREDISSYRKDVTNKCYGGDITRKKKLLNKQKIGKKKMRRIGKVDLPQSIFFELLNLE